jgi:hypothetical protein
MKYDTGGDTEIVLNAGAGGDAVEAREQIVELDDAKCEARPERGVEAATGQHRKAIFRGRLAAKCAADAGTFITPAPRRRLPFAS